MEWIKIKTRPATEEEKKEYREYFDEIGHVFDCQLPDDGQEVLITTLYGTVEKVTFCRDSYFGCYFEEYEEEGDVLAWMPLPDPFKSCVTCILDGTDACERGAGRATDIEACQSYLREE